MRWASAPLGHRRLPLCHSRRATGAAFLRGAVNQDRRTSSHARRSPRFYGSGEGWRWLACHCWGGSFFVIYRRYLKYLSKSTINSPGRSPPVRFFVADLIEKALSKRPERLARESAALSSRTRRAAAATAAAPKLFSREAKELSVRRGPPPRRSDHKKAPLRAWIPPTPTPRPSRRRWARLY